MAKILKKPSISPEFITLGQQKQASASFDPNPMPDFMNLQKSQIEKIREEAYQQGFLYGQEETKTLIGEQIIALKQQIEALILSIPQAIAENRLNMTQEIADIILMITQQYFIERATDPKALEIQINSILAQLNNKQTVELYLHPCDIALLQNEIIQLTSSHLNGITIKSDDSLKSGGCLIKTNHGIFDASLDKQIDKLKEYLLHLRLGGQNAFHN
ncbi:hypothetical protein EP47_09205 [Legionella norrlandica]|uniref:Flagellar assembly protein FliH n=1 Tax=Legionella norrlandica TaxID=1498499 RepID=A0A0A2SV51_9GAMM|nr:FliH/SctL family protein [Legionella norrlandica]KGP63299.1 hypothetical protein EP47_09205 [Legionella norrlandica]